MENVFIFLFGFLLGGFIIRALIVSSERGDAAHHGPIQRAILRHVRAHGTVNLAQAEYMLSMDPTLCAQYLNQLEHLGLVKSHGHDSDAVFYTSV